MTDPDLPAELPVLPLAGPLNALVRVPGSKSITNRALVLAALSRPAQVAEVRGALESEDTSVMVEGLRRLGYEVETDWHADEPTVRVRRPPGAPVVPVDVAEIDVANSGTTMRFLTALAALGRGRYRLDGVPRMRERPIEDLLDGLRQLEVDARAEAGTGCPPVVVNADGLPPGTVRLRGDKSSQFLSGLLLAAPLAAGPIAVEVDGLVSRPYADMTAHMMCEHHERGHDLVRVEDLSDDGTHVRYIVDGRRTPYGAPEQDTHAYPVEPDASSASYFLAAAAVCGGGVTVAGLDRRTSLQGDARFADLLERMGCEVADTPEGLRIRGGHLRGVDADMNAVSDTVMTLAAVAVYADGPTTIRNVAHIRHKETDRIAALAAELRRLGQEVEERDDGLTISPRPVRAAAVETYDDHRMAMSLAVVGLGAAGVVVKNPACVGKTYPRFWRDLGRLRGG